MRSFYESLPGPLVVGMHSGVRAAISLGLSGRQPLYFNSIKRDYGFRTFSMFKNAVKSKQVVTQCLKPY